MFLPNAETKPLPLLPGAFEVVKSGTASAANVNVVPVMCVCLQADKSSPEFKTLYNNTEQLVKVSPHVCVLVRL